MQRYFVEKMDDNHIVTLSDKDSYHIQKVMRMNIKDKIEVVLEKTVYICEIISIDKNVKAKICWELSEDNTLGYSVVLVQSLVKEQKMDMILQKCTELGVSGIYPYQAERSIVKAFGKESKKIERWNSITKEASEQSKQNKVPFVGNILSLQELCNLEGFDYKFLCTLNEKEKSLKKVLSNLKKGAKMIIVVGPEGGFTLHEEESLMNAGFHPISLGKSVLRTETAGMFFLSVIRYIDME